MDKYVEKVRNEGFTLGRIADVRSTIQNRLVTAHSDWVMTVGKEAICAYGHGCDALALLNAQPHVKGNKRFQDLVLKAEKNGEKIILLPRNHKSWLRVIPSSRKKEH